MEGRRASGFFPGPGIFSRRLRDPDSRTFRGPRYAIPAVSMPVRSSAFGRIRCYACRRHAGSVLTGSMVIRSIKQRSPLAFKAAEATHCAGEQGKYWEMHDRLFANQRELARPDLSKQAQALGLQKLQVNGTPTFFVGVTDPSSSEIKGTR